MWGGERERRGQKIGEYWGAVQKWREEREWSKGGREGRVKRGGGVNGKRWSEKVKGRKRNWRGETLRRCGGDGE